MRELVRSDEQARRLLARHAHLMAQEAPAA
jgi:hypothetical protein